MENINLKYLTVAYDEENKPYTGKYHYEDEYKIVDCNYKNGFIIDKKTLYYKTSNCTKIRDYIWSDKKGYSDLIYESETFDNSTEIKNEHKYDSDGRQISYIEFKMDNGVRWCSYKCDSEYNDDTYKYIKKSYKFDKNTKTADISLQNEVLRIKYDSEQNIYLVAENYTQYIVNGQIDLSYTYFENGYKYVSDKDFTGKIEYKGKPLLNIQTNENELIIDFYDIFGKIELTRYIRLCDGHNLRDALYRINDIKDTELPYKLHNLIENIYNIPPHKWARQIKYLDIDDCFEG